MSSDPQDEFAAYLHEQLRDPVFRRLYKREQRRWENGHEDGQVPVKPSLRRRGWRKR